MANWKKTFDHIISVEGTNYTEDHAGPTKFGITIPFLKRLGLAYDSNENRYIDEDDIRNLTLEEANVIYEDLVWAYYDYDKIIDDDVATKMTDMSINFGPYLSNRYLQEVLNAAKKNLVEDGIFGPKTLAAVNSTYPEIVLVGLRLKMLSHYQRLVNVNSEKYSKYLDGWKKRAMKI